MKQKKKAIKKPEPIRIGGLPIEDVIEPCKRPGLVRLTDKDPELALEWYYPNNCGFGPEDFSYGSKVNAHWQCQVNPEHIWRAQILTRCVKKRGCPQCFGTNLRNVKVPFERSLAHVAPDIAKEWHPTKNKDLTPKDILSHSKKDVWWQCKKNPKHAWKQEVCHRVENKTRCDVCYKESLHTLDKYPAALKLFDRKKNLGLKPEGVCPNTVVYWKCPVAPDHKWKGPFRTKMRCHFCTKRKVSSTSSLKALFPKLAKQLHPTRNGGRTGDEIRAYGKEVIWWRCSYNPTHIWPARIDNRTRNGSGCPECWKARMGKVFVKSRAEKKARLQKSG